MDFTFLNSSGNVAFFRSDAEQAEWVQEELSLRCMFPYRPEKVIERGMVILFQDPATNDWQAYEIRQCTITPGEYFQQITAEDIAISELTDCHIPSKDEISDKKASVALGGILSGTGWKVGTVSSDPISSGDIQRGNVWQNVTTISHNWNVYIMPRVTVNADGISGRFLDLLPSSGTDRGLRLAINKNVSDPNVTYDDSELYTALYGYGGTYTEGSGNDRATLEYNFADVVWSKTSAHPAKPKGQKYIEFPEMTALFGRKGKPRFGYYQNTQIKDPNVLLQKTWESLKQCCEPKVKIVGTVTDMKRQGYADVPLRLHDMAIIELEPVGLLMYKQIIKLTVDLLNPTNNRPEIGDYIPNIIYINRDTNDKATGGGGGRGGRGSTNADLEFDEYKTNVIDNGHQIILNAQHIDEQGKILQQAGLEIDPETGVLIYAEDNENMIGSKFHVQSDKIEAEITDRKEQGKELSSKITQTANKISLEVSERKAADSELSGRIDVEAGKIALVVDDNGIKGGSIVLAINAAGSSAVITADHIELNGDTIAGLLYSENLQCQTFTAHGEAHLTEGLDAPSIDISGTSVLGDASCDTLGCSGLVTAASGFRTHGNTATWQSYTARYCDTTASYTFTDANGNNVTGRLVTNRTDTTIYYLGHT